MDLTKLEMPTDVGSEPQVDNGITVTAAVVEVIFRNHRERLLEEIAKHSAVIGCVAWLTDAEVLTAMQACEVVSLVVQKEDFLKPDTAGRTNRLRKLYNALPKFSRYQIQQTSSLSYCSDPTSEAVRCVGNHNFERKPAFPRMHNKFLVFCELVHFEEGDYPVLRPVKVWTGSYNISDNASRSWENAVIIDDREAATAYANEFGQIFSFSEPLDWSSSWCAPTYRWGS